MDPDPQDKPKFERWEAYGCVLGAAVVGLLCYQGAVDPSPSLSVWLRVAFWLGVWASLISGIVMLFCASGEWTPQQYEGGKALGLAWGIGIPFVLSSLFGAFIGVVAIHDYLKDTPPWAWIIIFLLIVLCANSARKR